MPGTQITLTWQHQYASNAPARHRKACRYDAFIPELLGTNPLELTAETLGAVSEAENAIRDLNEFARPALEPFARLLLRTESIASSKVEGIQVGARQLARAETRKETSGTAGSEALEIISNIGAMQLAVGRVATSEREISIDDIRSIHRELLKTNLNSDIAGSIRTRQNWIGGNDYNPCGADFVPPPPENVIPLLENLCVAMNDDRLPPVVQAALIHAQFETIHPFDDGNGRTGRALIQVVLRRRRIAMNYVPPISVILAMSKDRYIAGLTRFRDADGFAPWIDQFAASTTSAAKLAEAYLLAVSELAGEWREMLATGPNPRQGAAAWLLIEKLPAYPIITAPIASAAIERTAPATNLAIEHLEAAGILIPASAGKRNKTWEAYGLLDLVGRFEAGQLPGS